MTTNIASDFTIEHPDGIAQGNGSYDFAASFAIELADRHGATVTLNWLAHAYVFAPGDKTWA